MFPITCNAIGDIIAVVQLLRDIVVALNDAHGAAEEYTQFVYVLKALGTVLGEVYDLAKASKNESLCQAVLEEVQRCCVDINSAHNSMAHFEKLEETSTRTTRGARAGLVLTKLRWHFLRASDAARYARRFSESHQRLNSYIGLLSHHSTSQLLGEHRYQALQVTHESRALRQSTEEMKAIALSALQQVSLQSRQQVVEQALTRPFFASPQDRRVASRAQRVADLIFDHFAPDTPAARREHFLSSLAPFLVAGAAFVLHANVDPQWRTTALWSAICALVVQALWLQSSTPLHPGFNCENAILLIDFFGETITVPFQLCRSSETFHSFLDLLYSDYEEDAREFVRLRLYELYLGGTLQLISLGNWSRCILPGTCLEMGIVLVSDIGSVPMCPYCLCEYDDYLSRGVICAVCSSQFSQTTETGESPNAAGLWARAAVLHRRHSTDIRTELSKMNAPFISSFSVAQYYQSPSALPNVAAWRRCPRVHVVNNLGVRPYAPEAIQSGSKMLMDTLLSEEASGRIRSTGYELLRSYVDIIENYGRWEPDDRDLNSLRVDKFVYDDARQNILGDIQGYGRCFGGPLTVEEQLLVGMVSTLDAFIAEPSREGVRRWKELANSHVHEFLSLEESQRVDELLKDHGLIGDYFHLLCNVLESK